MNDHTNNRWKQHTLTISYFLIRNLDTAPWVLFSGSHEGAIKVLVRLHSHLEDQLGKDDLPKSQQLLGKFSFLPLWGWCQNFLLGCCLTSWEPLSPLLHGPVCCLFSNDSSHFQNQRRRDSSSHQGWPHSSKCFQLIKSGPPRITYFRLVQTNRFRTVY